MSSQPVSGAPPAPPLAVEHAAQSAAQRAGRGWVLGAVLATMFMIALEATIVATAMPTIVGQLGGFDLFSWVFTGYVMSQAVTIPIYGRLADIYGRKRVLLFGISVFLTGSILCGLAWSMPALIVFRIIQGTGGGALLPVAMTLVGDLYAPQERARIQGLLSGAWGAAAILGPLIGAFLVAHLPWPSVFWINLPIGLCAGLLIAATLREQVQLRAHRIDYLGSVLMTLGTGVLMFAIVQGATLSLAVVIVLAAVAAGILASFFVHESRTAEPMLPLALFRNRIIAGAMIANFGVAAMLMGTTAFLPAYLQGVMGKKALVAGLILMGMTVSWSCGSTFSGQIALRTSYRTGATLGGSLLVIGSLIFIGLDPGRTTSWAGAGAIISGFGMGLISNSFLVALQSTVDWHQRGTATSTAVFMRMTGQGVGTAVFGGILNVSLAGDLAGGGNFIDRMLDPALRDALPPAQMAVVRHDFAGALHNVYLLGGVVALVVLAASLLLPAGLSPARRGGD
jgi:EmrB/QacA subfamily drug resistance transporter